MSNLALDRRMGFLDRVLSSSDTRVIIDSIQGYQTACNQAMYGLPFWKHVPMSMSPVFTRLVNHKVRKKFLQRGFKFMAQFESFDD